MGYLPRRVDPSKQNPNFGTSKWDVLSATKTRRMGRRTSSFTCGASCLSLTAAPNLTNYSFLFVLKLALPTCIIYMAI